ncbi:Ribosomal RNA-processing protein 12 [Smittium culicis]|uniref:Ribosomal RNA-processing protein 12 n=1 Tax=Smittium culicis TaxID=133412 RepID=A0A1R1YD21_9FUNG|nr:Ribosomal RNA-processing protein 12 [Smittium culicis]
MESGLDFELNKIRRLSSSNLQNQQQFAGTLIAIEETLKEQGQPLVPSSYAATLMTLLDQHKEASLDFVGPILYILAAILPFVPQSVIQAQFSSIMSILSTSLDLSKADPMTLRSVLTCLEHILKNQDLRVWKQPTAQKALQSVFILGLDSRPKVRRRGQVAAANILTNIPPPSASHPMANDSVEFILNSLKDANKDSTATVHVLQFMSTMFKAFPSNRFEDLSNILLSLLKMNDAFIYSEVLKCFESLFQVISVDFDKDLFFDLLNSIIAQRPNVNDASLSKSWLVINDLGFDALFRLNPKLCEVQIPSAFEMVKPYIELGKPEVKEAAIKCMETFVSKCLREGSACSTDVASKLSSSLVECLGIRYRESWVSIFYVTSLLTTKLGKSSRPTMDNLITLISEMRMEKGFEFKKEADATLGASISAMGPKLFLELLPLNIESSIPGMNQAPPKKNKGSNESTDEGRAWILPLMNGYIKDADIEYFIDHLLPLADKLEFYSQKLQTNGRAIQAKVVSVLSIQIWSLLGGFFSSPSDITKSFDADFVERILNQLVEVPELRSSLCTSLNTLVKNILKDLNSDPSLETSSDSKKSDIAEKNKLHISQFAPKILSTLFTIIADTPAPKGRYIHESATFQLKVTDSKDITLAFNKVLTMLTKALVSHTTPTAAESSSKYLDTNPQPPVYSMLDMIGTLAPFLDESSIFSALDVLLPLLSQPDDVILQKKTYKALGLFATSIAQPIAQLGENDISENKELNSRFVNKVLPSLISSAQFASPLSRRNRLNLLSLTTQILPNTELHIVPLFLSEAIIGTKDINEKSRLTSFELLDSLAQKMSLGGSIDASKLKNDDDLDMDNEGSDKEEISDKSDDSEGEMDQDGISAAEIHAGDKSSVKSASLEEYIEMVVAGLAAKTPYMISATVTSLAYLLNAYSEKLSPKLITTLLDTILLFVNSNSREIAKASLGFVKVSVLVLPRDYLIKALDGLVTGILKWANEHRARFSLKSRHIIERLIRRVGIDEVEKATPEEHKKLIQNIKKRKLRAKRGKTQNDDSENEKEKENSTDKLKRAVRRKGTFGINSDSDSSDDSDFFEKKNFGNRQPANNSKAGPQSNSGNSGKTQQNHESWIVEDDSRNDPLDFLSQSAFSQLSSSKPSKNLKNESFKKHVPTTKDGKFIFEDDEESAPSKIKAGIQGMQISGEDNADAEGDSNYYMEMVSSKDGFSRGNKNKIKFNKRKSNDGDDDGFGNDIKYNSADKKSNNAANKPKDTKRQKKDYGSEFKSKNGKGDTKKKGKLDPYAYIPMDPKLLSSKSGSKLNTMSKSKKDKRQANRN